MMITRLLNLLTEVVTTKVIAQGQKLIKSMGKPVNLSVVEQKRGKLSLWIVVMTSACSILMSNHGYAQKDLINESTSTKIDRSLLTKIQKFEQETFQVLIELENSLHLTKWFQVEDLKQRKQLIFEDLKREARASQRRITKSLVKKGLKVTPFYITNTLVVENASSFDLFNLAKNPQVLSIKEDVLIHLKEPDLKPILNEIDINSPVQRPAQIIGVDRVWNELGVKGKGIVIANQDTGVFFRHDALKNQYRGIQEGGTFKHNYFWYDAIQQPIAGVARGSCPIPSKEPCDDRGHGTHTIGNAVGFDGNDQRIGMAPEAQWISCRNMQSGVGRISTYLSCFQFFLAPFPVDGDPWADGRPEFAPHIVNNSWACTPREGCQGDEFEEVIQILHAAGIFVVSAAGNSGPSCGTANEAPGSYSKGSISVASFNRWTNEIASYSARGPSPFDGGLVPHITAPGTLVRSAIHTGPRDYESKAGTSMATPHVAGVVGLLWSDQPKLIGQIKKTTDLLLSTARPMLDRRQSCPGYPGSQVPNATFGYGMVDAYSLIVKARIEAARKD